ncbi:hypothetical protein ACPCAG_18710 [Streptomyces pseudogriseolus]|uniref:hypothetical protein n=1 Tax=Streptomyces pseudogriseolus TaxID=36817 RepID=UPI003FA2BE03
MTPHAPGPAARLPLRAAAAVLAAFAAVLLTLGFTSGADPASAVAAGPAAPAYFPASPGTPTYSSGTQPHSDEAYVAARTVLARPERDAGERDAAAGPLLFTPAYTPRVPPRPARPAPAAGHAPPAAAHVPADLGRAPPTCSST